MDRITELQQQLEQCAWEYDAANQTVNEELVEIANLNANVDRLTPAELEAGLKAAQARLTRAQANQTRLLGEHNRISAELRSLRR